MISIFLTLSTFSLCQLAPKPEKRVDNTDYTSALKILDLENDDDIVAEVNTHKISYSAIKFIYKNMLTNHLAIYKTPLTFENVIAFRKDAVNRIIQKAILKHQLKIKNFTPSTEDFEKAFADFKKIKKMDDEKSYQTFLNLYSLTDKIIQDDFRFNMGMQKLIKSLDNTVNPPEEDQIKNFYDKNTSLFTTEEQINYSIILLKHVNKTDEEKNKNIELLKKIRKDILDEKKTFEFYARNFSDDTSTRANGGVLGLKPVSRIYSTYPFLKEVKIDKISPVFDHPDYSMIAKINQHLKPQKILFEKAQNAIKLSLWRKSKVLARKKFMDELNKVSNIKIIPFDKHVPEAEKILAEYQKTSE